MDYMETPNIITTLRKSDIGFAFRVQAYRKLSESEMYCVLRKWMAQTRRKTLPKNKTITYHTIHGFDD